MRLTDANISIEKINDFDEYRAAVSDAANLLYENGVKTFYPLRSKKCDESAVKICVNSIKKRCYAGDYNDFIESDIKWHIYRELYILLLREYVIKREKGDIFYVPKTIKNPEDFQNVLWNECYEMCRYTFFSTGERISIEKECRGVLSEDSHYVYEENGNKHIVNICRDSQRILKLGSHIHKKIVPTHRFHLSEQYVCSCVLESLFDIMYAIDVRIEFSLPPQM